MIGLTYFQINIFTIFTSILLLIFFFLKKIDLLSILALTSSFYNLVIFNYKPWTFGFQIFFFFAIIFILLSLKNLIVNLKNKNNLILLAPVFIFIFIVLLGEVYAYLNEPEVLVIRPKEDESISIQEVFKFSRLNITQFLYLIFFFMIFLSAVFQKNINLLKIFKFYLFSLNLNLIFQIFEIFYFKIYKNLPNFLINLSFTPEIIQKVPIKNFEFYRFSGLLPTPSLLGIYLFLGLLILILFKENFTKKFLIFQSTSIILSGLLSFSGTFLFSLFITFLIFIFKEKKYLSLLLALFILIISLYFIIEKPSFKIRLENMFYAIKIFKNYPLLGIGLGSHFSSDLLTTLLSTTGILGLLSFLSIFVIPFIKSFYINDELLLKLTILTLLPLILILLIWHSININIFWVIVGIWYNKLKQCLR